MKWFLHQILERRVKREAHRQLQHLKTAQADASRHAANRYLDNLAKKGGHRTISLGDTTWRKPVEIPVDALFEGHAFVSGSSGSGKTRSVLGIAKSIIDDLPEAEHGLGILDGGNRDLFDGTLKLIAKRLMHLEKEEPHRADALRRRLFICDFAAADPICSYNILARRANTEADYFASVRAEGILDLLAANDRLSLAGSGLLQKLLMLCSAHDLPVTWTSDLLGDAKLLDRLISTCSDDSVRRYFSTQFAIVPTVTISALQRRMEALFSSNRVSAALA